LKRFEIITESDARVLERGETVMLAKGGHITPLAADTLRDRRVTVVREGQAPDAAAALVPKADIRSVAIASDHTGIALRQGLIAYLRSRGLAVNDLGTYTAEPVDYLTSRPVWRPPGRPRYVDAGIVIDGAGRVGIAANKVNGVRAVMATTETIARILARAQRRERAHARRDAGDEGRGAGDRDDVADDVHARTAIHCAARENRRAGKPRPEGRAYWDRGRRVTRGTAADHRRHRRNWRRLARGRACRCQCHGVLGDCCPDRLSGVIDAGATRVGLHAAGGAPQGVA
jgi:hypothetical protein